MRYYINVSGVINGMLLIKSNFGIFKDRLGQAYTEDDLKNLCKSVIRSDCVNFGLKKVGGGFNSVVSDRIFNKIGTKTENAEILIFNDFSLQMLNRLIDEGFERENIYLAYGSWNKDGTPSDNEYALKIMRLYIRSNFVGDFNVISLKEAFGNMKFDIIIANPPYGSIGAKITNHIRENIDYGEFINLLPANDYKRIDGLWNYAGEMETCQDVFEDAAVTTHIAKINKDKVNDMSVRNFETSLYKDLQLIKYFKLNTDRSYAAFDTAPMCGCGIEEAKKWDISKTFVIGHRDMNHGHLPYSRASNTYLWNVKENITVDQLAKNILSTKQLMMSNIIFNTAAEKKNFVNFVYSDNGFRFLSKLFTAAQIDGGTRGYILPKVDWTHPWTVEEILKDYGYTDSEIKEVVEDLKNYRGMND